MALQKMVFLNEHGHEVPDPKPVEIPSGFKIPETLEARIARLIRKDISEQAAMQGMETFEEAEDFDIDDEMFDPSSPYEEVFDPVLGRGITLAEFNKNEAVYRQRYLEAEQRAFEQMRLSEALRAVPRAPKTDAPVSPSPAGKGTEGEGAEPSN